MISIVIFFTVYRYNETENLQDMAITAILCPEVQFVLSEGEIFLLRCDYELTPVPREACDGIVAVQCGNTPARLLISIAKLICTALILQIIPGSMTLHIMDKSV